jgi:hypothetical protein
MPIATPPDVSGSLCSRLLPRWGDFNVSTNISIPV